MTPQLSVIVPCYNESEAIESLLRTWTHTLNATVDSYEVIVINDGSSDGTGRILDRCRKEIPHLRVIHQLNAGVAGALRRGLELARGDFALLLSVDERYEPSDFLRLWEMRGDSVQVLATRTHRVEGLLRRLSSEALNRFGGWLFKVDLTDPSTCFRLIRRDYLEHYLEVLPKPLDSLLAALSFLIKRDHPALVIEVPIHYGKSKGLRPRRRLLLELAKAAQMTTELLRLRTRSPLLLALPLGEATA